MTLRSVPANKSPATPLNRNSRKSAQPASPFAASSSCCSTERSGLARAGENLDKILEARSLCATHSDAVMGLVVAVLCRGARYRAFPNSKRGFSAFSSTSGRGLKRDTKGGERSAGGDGGIRTLDRALQPYNGLANRRLQPLGHISGRNARRDICPTPPPIASVRRQSLSWVLSGKLAVERGPFSVDMAMPARLR